MLDNIVIESSQKVDHVMIWLHGLGADGSDFVPFAHEFQESISIPFRFIFPNAPIRPVTVNNGYKMRAWYDITGLDLAAREDQEGLNQVCQNIDQLIQEQIEVGVSPQNIFLGGFSQGGASILYSGLRHFQKLAGLIVLSGYLPLGRNLEKEKNSVNQDIPIFWGHGNHDPIVPVQWAEISKQQLVSSGFQKLSFHTYPIDHYVCPEEIQDLKHWMEKVATI
jgi:phospholipase/carboxylesterase